MAEFIVIGSLVLYWVVIEILYALLHDDDRKEQDVHRQRTELFDTQRRTRLRRPAEKHRTGDQR